MDIDDRVLMAYADGELSAEEMARVRSAIASDPATKARFERISNVRAALHRAYDPVLEEPPPEHLMAILGAAPESNVTELGSVRERKRAPLGGPPAWAAMAASVMVGLLVGRALSPGDALFNSREGEIYAGPALERVLDARLSGDAEDDTRIGLSFRALDGAYCRTFARQRGENAVSGLACRDGENWAVRIAVNEPAPAGGYRQAAAAAPAVLEAVDALIDGAPMDRAEEEAARAAGWAR